MSEQGWQQKYRLWLASEDPYLRETALAVFQHARVMDGTIKAETIRLLRTDDVDNIRRKAVEMLSDCRDPGLQPVLLEALGDHDWEVRGKAFLGLSRLDGCLELPEVRDFIEKETHPYVRWCIEDAQR